MTAFFALAKAIRTTLVLALVSFLAFGSLAASASTGPASTASGGHHSSAADGDHDQSGAVAANCPAQADGTAHDMDDGSCCVGTCATILGVLPVEDAPGSRISEIEPFDRLLCARGRVAEFLRPPSLTI